MENKKITTRKDNYSQWYLDVVEQAELAENSQTKGSMVIKPYGYSIWEVFQKTLDKMIKDTGHKNVYFPLLIPKSFLTREAEHIKGFAKETAVVTHYRLKKVGNEIAVDPESKLGEELIIRPTSETIMYDTFSRWIHSWRDLPLLLNQWANVVRWEMRTRPFLRTTEFLWQEGHTAHSTEQEAEHEAQKMLDVYANFAENYLAVPVIKGQKTEQEKFAGALRTYSIEAMMQDGKALQAGTSHNLGQNFAKVFDVKFTDKDEEVKYVWQTSWGVSTRLIGALIMAHSDDNGLVLPPAIAPIKIVIIPIYKNDQERASVLKAAEKIKDGLREIDENIFVDDRDYETPGAKFNEWEKKGIPIRIEIGPKDIEKTSVVVVRRDTSKKTAFTLDRLREEVKNTLTEMQRDIYERALKFRNEHIYKIDSYEELKEHFTKKDYSGFVYSHWCGNSDCETKICDELKVSSRVIPFDQTKEKGVCIKCGKVSKQRIIFAKAY